MFDCEIYKTVPSIYGWKRIKYEVQGEKPMDTFSEQDLQLFLDRQTQLFPEPVAETLEEAEYFLEDCMAVVCVNAGEVRQYFEEEGVDLCGMSQEELLEQPEVFALSGGRYLIVES